MLIFGQLNAQMLHANDVILQPSELLKDTKSGSNTAIIHQEGVGNDIRIIQEKSEGDLLENLVRVLQDGRRNVALITQRGSGNEIALIQSGNRNIYDLISDGSEIDITIIQEGRRNEILQRIENSENIYVEFEQRGNNNSIIHEINGLSNEQFIIRQIGDDMNVVIRQSGQ